MSQNLTGNVAPVLEIEITADSQLRLSPELARAYFPSERCSLLRKSPTELLIIPVQAANAGLVLKQISLRGVRSIFAGETLGDTHPVGVFPARWENRRLVVQLPANPTRRPLARPQPIGIFPLPAGMLLFPSLPADHPDYAAAEEVRSSLLAGHLPSHWPSSLAGQQAVYDGDFALARQIFSLGGSRGLPDSLARFNLFVLDPDSASLDTLRPELAELGLTGLADLVAFTNGRLPDLSAWNDENTTGEVAALFHAAKAALATDEDAAVSHLRQGIELTKEFYPVMAAIFSAELAGRALDLAAAEFALSVLKDTELILNLAEAYLARGTIGHAQVLAGTGNINEAIADYQQALNYVPEELDPYLFARIHLNLGTAYLISPLTAATDNVRHGVAVQSLRAALRNLALPQHPAEWLSATLNLANALVYSPSADAHKNLLEAVELYEKILQIRPAEFDPIGRAQVLANQGAALAHLGLRDDARGRLLEARALFAAEDVAPGVATVEQALAELDQASGKPPAADKDSSQ